MKNGQTIARAVKFLSTFLCCLKRSSTFAAASNARWCRQENDSIERGEIFLSTIFCGFRSSSTFVAAPKATQKFIFEKKLPERKKFISLRSRFERRGFKKKKFFDNIAIAASQDPC